MARIKHSTRFDQQKLHLVFRVRLVLYALPNNEHLARRYMNCTIPKIDPQNAF
jgi:hypothetical protein